MLSNSEKALTMKMIKDVPLDTLQLEVQIQLKDQIKKREQALQNVLDALLALENKNLGAL